MSNLPNTMPAGLCPGRKWIRVTRTDGELVLSETLRDDEVLELAAELAGVLLGVECLNVGLYDGDDGSRIVTATLRVTRDEPTAVAVRVTPDAEL